jgi:hypothetical protein
MYKIIGADGHEYGPVTGEQLRQWIADGRANGQTKAQAEGSTEWRPLSAFPEFADLFGAATTTSGPGAATSSAPQFSTRRSDLDIGSCISRAWKLLQGHFGGMVGTSLLVIIILGGVSGALRVLVNTAFGVPMFVRGAHGLGLIRLQWRGIAVSSLWNLLMAGPLLGGLYNYYLKLIRGQPATIGDAFAGFSRSFVPLLMAHVVSAFLTCLGILCCVIPGIYLGVAWKFTLPLVIDKQLGFWDAMELSRKTVTPQWWSLFALILLAGLISAAGLIVCCIGILATVPIGIATILYAYNDMLGGGSGPQPT